MFGHDRYLFRKTRHTIVEDLHDARRYAFARDRPRNRDRSAVVFGGRQSPFIEFASFEIDFVADLQSQMRCQVWPAIAFSVLSFRHLEWDERSAPHHPRRRNTLPRWFSATSNPNIQLTGLIP